MSIIRPLAAPPRNQDERSIDSPANQSAANPSAVGQMAVPEQPLYLEDLEVGDRWSSEFREITSKDVEDFAALTGDHDPLHRSDSVQSPFGEPIAHGLLGLSILAGLSTRSPKVATLALVGITQWEFESPIFFGDRVRVVTEIEEIHQHGRRAGRVTWKRQLINQHGRVVQQGRFVSIVASRHRSRRLSPHESDSDTQRSRTPR